jgi:23S rRNA (adenine2503-C2)-methyltransferase
MLSGLLPEELANRLGLSPPYRGRQVFSWIHAKGEFAFDRMSNLPASERSRLSRDYSIPECEPTKKICGTESGKVTVRCRDGETVEAVVILHPRSGTQDPRITFCISSQVGCPMRCRFCRTGAMGFRRDLTASQIVDQVLILRDLYGAPSNIVYMGMGEPLLNLGEVYRSIRVLGHAAGLAMSPRRITISTCGIPEGILDLAETMPEIRLAVSLVSAEETVRRDLMPGASRFSLSDLHSALKRYQRTGRRITVEYVLLEGINDTLPAITALEQFCGELSVMVNVIRWNQYDGASSDLHSPSEGAVRKFTADLRERGLNATLRRSKGRGIDGACGLLATSHSDHSGQVE